MNVAREGSNSRWVLALLALGAAAGSLAPARVEAQCQVVAAPRLFDPPPGGVQPSTLQGRQDRLIVGGTDGAKRLLVRYNYGFLVYDLSSPAAPSKVQQKDLRTEEKYPVAGDGQTRAGMVSYSSDGARALVPWGAADFGTVALSGAPLSGGGEYLPTGSKTNMTAIVKASGRYLAFSATYSPSSGSSLWVADISNIQRGVIADQLNQNQIGSWPYVGPSLGGQVAHLKVVEAGARAFIVAASTTAVTVVDVSSPGPAGVGITNGFSHRTYSTSELGLSGPIKSVAAASHPTDGGLYLLVETAVLSSGAYQSGGVTLSRVTPPSTPGGSFGPAQLNGAHTPDAAVRKAQPGILLLPFDSDVVAVYFEGALADGALHLNVRSSTDFGRNLADGLKFATPTQFEGMDGFRSSGGTFHVYMGLLAVGTYAASVNCELAPTPAEGTLSVEKVPATGPTLAVPDNGTVFVGDELRIRPSFAPSDTIQPVTDWRFDYAFHEGSPTDASGATPFLVNPDVPFTPGSFPAQLTLVGPCDPSQDGDQNVSNGTGCWDSVLASSDFASPDPAAGSVVQIPLAFEVRNALNEGSSDLTKHRINWKVPKPLLKSASILSGEAVEDGSEGTPHRTSNGYRWYFASAPVGESGSETLTLKADCTGPICNPALTQRGTYRYWVSVPYRNGFRTPDCPGLEGTACTVPTAPTVAVTDVVLGFSVPESGNVSAQGLTIGSTSKKGTAATPCGGTSGFTYDLCTVTGGDCPEGSYTGVGFVATNPFPATGTGTVTIPMPQEGTYGVRIRYQYTTTGDCGNGNADALTARWPDQGQWAPLTVIRSVPTVKLFNSTGTTELSKWAGTYSLTTGQTARAYAYVNDVRESALPPGASIIHTNSETGQVTQIGTTQGASFSIATRGDYVVTLRGYGVDATAAIAVEAPLGGGGGGGGTTPQALSISSIWANPATVALGQPATISCSATGGTAPYSYSFSYGDGSPNESSTTGVVTHAFSVAGTKTVRCTATDSANANRSASVFVTVGTSTGSCDFIINDSTGAKLSFDPFSRSYDAISGQPLTFVASNVTGTPSWTFRPGATAIGNPATYTYTITGLEMQSFTATLTATGCSKSYPVNVTPSSGQSFLDFAIADADTGTALARTGTVYGPATAGQRLKFTASGATGDVSWVFGDGTSSAEASPVKVYAPAVDASYTVTLTNGANTKQYTVSVKGSTGAPLTGNYTYQYADGTNVNRSAVEPNKPIRFTGADQATTYTWDFGDGTPLAQGSPKDYSFTRGGTFSVKLTVARNGVPGTVSTATPTVFTVKPPPDPLLWVAGGMAYTDNGAGVKWQSDLSIHNPGTTTATVSLAYVAGATWDGATKVTWIPQALVAGETKSYTNVLKSLFLLDQGAWGVVLVRGDDIPVPPVIVSRTYNAANADEVGTFGLSVPALSVAGGVQPQSAGGGNVLAGLRHDDVFRTNLAIANLKGETAEVEVVFRDVNGNVLGVPALITIEARGVKQIGSVLAAKPAEGGEAIGGAGYATPTSDFSAEVKLRKGSGIYPYATVIDNGTGDSIVVTPAPRPSPSYRLPGVVRVQGKNGPFWMSDVAVLNPSAKERRVRVTYSYKKVGAAGRATMENTLVFKPWEMKIAVDFVKTWLGLAEGDLAGYADSFVDIAPAADDAAPTENLVVVGKTYMETANGSIGLQLDGFAYEDGISAQGSRQRVVLSGLEANRDYRTNLALFLTPGSTGSAQVDVRVLDSFGRESKKISSVGLNADAPFVQIGNDSLFAGLTTGEMSRATIVIDNPRGTAVVGAYATVIDNRSEDATFVAGQPAP
ncbi:MAG: PKD domain-containing protein [Thermoanaerobaculia bacterium]